MVIENMEELFKEIKPHLDFIRVGDTDYSYLNDYELCMKATGGPGFPSEFYKISFLKVFIDEA